MPRQNQIDLWVAQAQPVVPSPTREQVESLARLVEELAARVTLMRDELWQMRAGLDQPQLRVHSQPKPTYITGANQP